MSNSEPFVSLLPNTSSVSAALAFAKKYLDPPSYNHVLRSALFGAIMIRNLNDQKPETHLLPADVEVIAVANILHDMAWNPELDTIKIFVSKDKRFEVDGANAARDFLATLPASDGWDQRRTQLVWDAIALHTSSTIAWHKEPEVAVGQYGILIDVLGMHSTPLPGVPAPCAVSQAEYDEINVAYPRLKLATYLKGAFCALCTQKPETTFDNFVSGYGEEYIEGYTLTGKRLVDQMKSYEAAEEKA